MGGVFSCNIFHTKIKRGGEPLRKHEVLSWKDFLNIEDIKA